MKLYFFQAGTLKSFRSVFFNNGGDSQIHVPAPFFLIQHRGKNILFDTGQHKDDIKDHFTPTLKTFATAFMDIETEYAPNAIKKVGLTPEDIDFVIISHLHHDHAGAIGEFPNATYIVQREEYDYVRRPDYFMAASYFNDEAPAAVNNYDMKGTEWQNLTTNVDWFFLDGWQDDKFDIFGDGKIVIYYTPGHTVGHQSLMVRTDKDGDFFLTADACYTNESIELGILPGIVVKPQDYIRSLKRVRMFKKAGITVVTGHDDEAWETFRHAPEYYE